MPMAICPAVNPSRSAGVIAAVAVPATNAVSVPANNLKVWFINGGKILRKVGTRIDDTSVLVVNTPKIFAKIGLKVLKCDNMKLN